jgi:hypothetical protein
MCHCVDDLKYTNKYILCLVLFEAIHYYSPVNNNYSNNLQILEIILTYPIFRSPHCKGVHVFIKYLKAWMNTQLGLLMHVRIDV